jgi:hypothetical protein
MIDVATQKPIKVGKGIESGPFIEVSMAQLDKVRAVLDAHGIKYWVSDSIMSFNGAPPVTWVHFYRKSDPQEIQARLDGDP